MKPGPEGHDEDDDGEGEAEDLRRRRFELGEDEAAQLDAKAVDVRDAVADRIADVAGDGEVDVLGHLDVRVGDASRVLALRGHEPLVARLVGALDPAHPIEAGDLVEQRLHGRLHGGVVDTLVRLEDDRSDGAGALAAELGVEGVEALGRLCAGEAEVGAVGLTHPTCDPVGKEEGGDPQAEGETASIVTPGTDACGEAAPSREVDSTYARRHA